VQVSLQAGKDSDAAPVLGGDRGVEQMVVLPCFGRVAGVAVPVARVVAGHSRPFGLVLVRLPVPLL
jgi:hypothetical protein